tara:strand:+ start:594 stop:758 length:165 start_codon:yes stop_codon:yes gene_type:complete
MTKNKSKFYTVEIFISEDGTEKKIVWDYLDRFPTHEEKQSTRDFLRDENKKLQK